VRRIHPHRFSVAGRGTSRESNPHILLNLVRSHQTVAGAHLWSGRCTTRAAVTFLCNDRLEEVFGSEGAKGEAARGRKPQFLYIDSRKRWVLAIDIRATRTSLMLCDLLGEPLVGVTRFPTQTDGESPSRRSPIASGGRSRSTGISANARASASSSPAWSVQARPRAVLAAPRMARRAAARRAGSGHAPARHRRELGRACALAQLWSTRADASAAGDIAFVSVSDGIGVGIVVRRRAAARPAQRRRRVRPFRSTSTASPCACGASGCWEA
jgi:hypothetical protein